MVCGIMVGSGIFASPADMLCKVLTTASLYGACEISTHRVLLPTALRPTRAVPSGVDSRRRSLALCRTLLCGAQRSDASGGWLVCVSQDRLRTARGLHSRLVDVFCTYTRTPGCSTSSARSHRAVMRRGHDPFSSLVPCKYPPPHSTQVQKAGSQAIISIVFSRYMGSWLGLWDPLSPGTGTLGA